MAQTKARNSRSTGATRGGKKTKKSTNARRSSGGSTSKSTRSTQRRSSPQSRQRTQSHNGKSTVGKIAEKAKGPALAGGAALVGIAGGMALTRRQKRGGVLGKLPNPKLKTPKLSKLNAPSVSLPKPNKVARAVGSAAGQVAERSQTVSQVASQVQRASEAIDGSRDSDS
jgi:hypothetical protein